MTQNIKKLIELLDTTSDINNETFVIYIDDNIMSSDGFLKAFAEDVNCLKRLGVSIIIVHGGEKTLDEAYKELNIECHLPNNIQIIEMLLTGFINKKIVSEINKTGSLAAGISGKDAKLIEALKVRKVKTNNNSNVQHLIHDCDQGVAENINPDILLALESNNIIPVISPLAEENGKTLQLDGLHTASLICCFLAAERFIIMSYNDEYDTLTNHMDFDALLLLKPKKNTALQTLIEICKDVFESNTNVVLIIKNQKPHSLLHSIIEENEDNITISNNQDGEEYE